MNKTGSRMLQTPGYDMPITSNSITVGFLFKRLTAGQSETLRQFVAMIKRLCAWAKLREEGA